MVVSSEVKLVSAAAGLYGSFLYWGYLQEKITGADYVSPVDASVTGRWHFSFVLNGEGRPTRTSHTRTSWAPPTVVSLGRRERERPARKSIPIPLPPPRRFCLNVCVSCFWSALGAFGTHSALHKIEHVCVPFMFLGRNDRPWIVIPAWFPTS